MLSRDQIEKILSAELDAAKKRNAIAAGNFRSVINDLPSGIPFPDSKFRIQMAGAEHRKALDGLHRALKRLNGFKVLGIIPEDLNEPITAR